MQYRNYIATPNSITVIFDEKVVPLYKSNPLFERVKDLLRAGDPDEIAKTVDLASNIKLHTSGKFYVVNGRVYLGEEVIPEALSNRLIQFVEAEIDTEPLIKFWNNLKLNPSEDSREELYGFLESAGVPLTEDGCFIAYKRVANDFKDLYTRTIDNSPGQVVKMDRDTVDPNRNVTCSRGLHASNFKYASNIYGSNCNLGSRDRLVAVKINPKDVVSVPVDYNNTKMRVCEYRVIEEITHEFKDVPVVSVKECCNQKSLDAVDYTNKQPAKNISAYARVKRQNSGRLNIPKFIVEHAGMKVGDRVKVNIEYLKITLSKSEDGRLTVQERGSIVISPADIDDAGFNPYRYFDVRSDGEKIFVE